MRPLTQRLAATVIATVLATGTALAHHGWFWTADGDFVLEGIIQEIYLGNPHATLKVQAEDELWHVDLAPPSRTAAAGFVEGVANVGDEVILVGQRSADENELVMKAVRVTIDGVNYDVYPNRVGS
ncbi:DUF6152 family protein [Bauldia sp.]|uniref:DUF6152 family protein n=1 Tax=Bauldia sp. TaxID=2575872 RepID=UPI003BA96891